MTDVLSILDTNGLISIEAVDDYFHKRPLREVVSLMEGLGEAIRAKSRSLICDQGRSTIDQANFLPSSSMRGDRGCSVWECRVKKVQLLARYVALYCDKAVVPTNFEVREIDNDTKLQGLQRADFALNVQELVTLRPLIEEGLIVLVPEELHFCKQHLEQAVPQHKNIVAAADKLARKNSAKFKFTYEPLDVGGQRISSISVKGPEDYLEHGAIVRVLDRTPSWVSHRNRSRKFVISDYLVRKHNLLLPFFRPLASDAFIQSYFGLAFNARYVTDLPVEAEFFRTLNASDELNRETAALCARLTHVIPMLQDIPIESILTLRRNEPEAFQNYRSTLTSIVRDRVRKGTTIREREANDIYLDLLKPQLDALQSQARNVRRAQLKRSTLKVVASSALVGLGIYSGLLPSHLADIVKTIGGFSVAKDLAETIGALEKNPTEIRNHNLYFLLRLKQDGS